MIQNIITKEKDRKKIHFFYILLYHGFEIYNLIKFEILHNQLIKIII